jgi:very-short-patch-repair endonuclease
LSKGEERVLKALALFGNHRVAREHPIGERLRLDFYIKNLNLAYEVQGIQHTEFNGFHYDSKEAFAAAKLRDKRKVELCMELGITLVHLTYDEVMRSKDAESLLALILERTKEARTKAGDEEEDEW